MKHLFAAVMSIVLAGCATGMSYHAYDELWQLGYSDTRLAENTFRVSYAGYNIPQSRCDEFAIMRAAELTRSSGARYFRILNGSQSSSTQTFVNPGVTYTQGSIAPNYAGGYSYRATSNTVGAMAVTATRPVSTFIVATLKDGDDTRGALDADMIWKETAKYRQ